MNKYNIFVKILLDRISKPSVGIDGSAFSKNIVRKYGIFRNSGRLPSLIFLRLFGNRSVNKKINSNNRIFINNNIKNTISHEYITNKYYETGDYRSFPISTTTDRAPGITVNSINLIANNYLQRFINIRNTGPKFNKLIYPEIWYFANEDHFIKLLQIIKKNKQIADKNISQETANISIPEQDGIVNNNIDNTISHEYITNKYYGTGDDISFPTSTTTVRVSGITVNLINPIANNYLQRFINIRNTDSKSNKSIYPEIQYFANVDQNFKFLQIINKNRQIADKNISQETANISIPEQDGIVNYNINNNTISHEYITNKYYGTGDDISFPTSTTTVRVSGITVNLINPIANNYLQRFINIRNTDSKSNKSIYPEIQYFANVDQNFKFLQIINKNRQIADKNISQETANISIPEQDGIVNYNINNNTISHEYITNKYYNSEDHRSFPISTTTVRASGITVNSINPIANNYLQRFINIRNTGPKSNKLIYPEIQYFTNEKHLFKLLQIFKKNRSIVDKNISQETANVSIPKQGGIVSNTNINNTIPREYITNKYYETGDDISFPISTTTVRASGITVNPINPIANNYLQRFINIRNTGPKSNKLIYPEIQYFTNEKHLFKLLGTFKKNRSIIDKNISQKTANISIPDQGGIVNNTNIKNTIPHEYTTNRYYETEDIISFPILTTIVRASGITANSINPIVSNYLQRFINIRNTGSTLNKPIYPEIQYFTNENHIFKLLQIINKNRPIADENISQETVNISNSQQSRIVNNTGLYNHIIKKSSKIINYFQEINSLQNIGSRVVHPLIHVLDTSFNEEELFHKKIFPIQEVDLTYASEPVLNIPTSQNTDIVQEKIENIPAGSINSTGINESLIKESSQHKSVPEIHMIADKVYKIIEKKISVEKDRRGLF